MTSTPATNYRPAGDHRPAGDDRPAGSRRSCIVLIGLRGSGKTTVGRELALLVGGSHLDTDDLIVARVGRCISDIFREFGEHQFRSWETEAIAELVRRPPTVVSVGGGAVLDPSNVSALKSIGTLVWLTAPPDVLWLRIRVDPTTAQNRPALTRYAGEAEITALLAERAPLYARTADATVRTENRTPIEVAREILTRFPPV